ncbi:hypothetical protein BpHYR1_054096 [Brachionus plicatilis]|uniref:Uncharacterized protein n=1 Tax=Brachionus plicatilis TaxID=10195 RepID=A0A3M7RXX5_BRAPC|nr:hypothetical protein BpHYR1_054096 [Brachionus plicatilis]
MYRKLHHELKLGTISQHITKVEHLLKFLFETEKIELFRRLYLNIYLIILSKKRNSSSRYLNDFLIIPRIRFALAVELLTWASHFKSLWIKMPKSLSQFDLFSI